MEKGPFVKGIWNDTEYPILLFASAGHEFLCQNKAADVLCGGAPVPEALTGSERNALFEALDNESSSRPVFCHIGKDVFSAVLLQESSHRICLLQKVTAYYNDTQSALEEARLASQAKTVFLSEMSHDIRTPMGAILGLTEIALSQKDVPEKIAECLGKIKTASGHMMSLLNEVLDISRIESGKVVLHPEETSVADLLHEILIVAKPQADAKKQVFSLKMGEIACERILADNVRLKQICLNVLSNAVKYTPEGGRVDLFFSIGPTEEPQKVRFLFSVKDNGIGMSEEFREKIFIPFEREQKSTVNKIQGTGLGMAITKNLTDLMHGDITVESELGKGSCFIIDIPFEAAQEEPFPEEFRGKRILFLDGDEERAAQITKMLAELGMEADHAKTAEDAVEFINDIMLSDGSYMAFLSVEKVPGIEMMLFLPEVRRRMGTSFPIIMLSESDWSQTEYLLTKAGVDSFIPMPLFKSRLAEGLSAYTASRERVAGEQTENKTLRDFSNKRILLIDDNELNREIALELLGVSGAKIETAENGLEAVERFRSSAPFYYDMLLMDIQMPVMNGLDATRAIRALTRDDARQVPILAMTANAFVEDVQNALDAGMDAHISKPLDMDRVFSTMELFLGRQRT